MGTEIAEIIDAEVVEEPSNLPMASSGTVSTVDINYTRSPEAQAALDNSGRKATRDTYASAWRSFAKWCASTGRTATLPTTEANLTTYVQAQREAGAPPSSIRRDIAAVVWMNRRAGFPDQPDTAPALSLYADHRHETAKAGRVQRTSAPVHLDRLELLLSVCDPNTLAGRRNRVILLLGFFIRGRASELAALKNKDVDVHSGSLLVVTKRTSKADKLDEGIEYDITDPSCIAAVMAWQADLKAAGISDGQPADGPERPFLRSVTTMGGLRKPGKTGQGITRQSIWKIVKAVANEAGLFNEKLSDGTPNPEYVASLTPHGLRAGAPTELARTTEMTIPEIMEALGDWSSEEMVRRYAKLGRRDSGRSGQERHRAAAMEELRLDRPGRERRADLGY